MRINQRKKIGYITSIRTRSNNSNSLLTQIYSKHLLCMLRIKPCSLKQADNFQVMMLLKDANAFQEFGTSHNWSIWQANWLDIPLLTYKIIFCTYSLILIQQKINLFFLFSNDYLCYCFMQCFSTNQRKSSLFIS